MSISQGAWTDRIAIFAKTFARPTLEETLWGAFYANFRRVQLNLSSAGLPTLPERFDPAEAARVASTVLDCRVRVVALSATFNMIDPDVPRRKDNLRRLAVMAEWGRALGVPILTLCTGTRDPDDMWRHHPGNDDPSAWADLVASIREAVAIAEPYGITLAFEPEVGNVVDSAVKARALLDEIGSHRLKVVLDVANLIRPGEIPRMRAIIDEAFDLLAPDIALVHAKEIAADGSVGEITPGKGVLDFAHIVKRYRDANLEVPIVHHGLPEPPNGVPYMVDFLWHEVQFLDCERRFSHDGLTFRYLDRGEGLPVVFQHGLGGDLRKMHDLFQIAEGYRLLSFDARYHGKTRPLGPPEKIGFDQSADDLLALLDHLGIEKAVIGGLSMGAGIALNFAVRYPQRTLGLILSRPAWLDEPFPENVRMFPEMAALIRELGVQAARETFQSTEAYANVLAESSDSASALLGMFDDPTCEETVEKFERIPRDCPSRDRSAWREIAVPTLVLANYQDPIHPYAMGPTLASVIPRSILRLLTPKCVNVEAHEWGFHGHIREYLARHFPDRPARG